MYCKKDGNVMEECYRVKECMYFHKKCHEEKVFRKKHKYGKEKENGKANVAEEIVHDDIFFGDVALACKNKIINKVSYGIVHC